MVSTSSGDSFSEYQVDKTEGLNHYSAKAGQLVSVVRVENFTDMDSAPVMGSNVFLKLPEHWEEPKK